MGQLVNKLSQTLESSPALRPYLSRLADDLAKGKPLPAVKTLGNGLHADDLHALRSFFGAKRILSGPPVRLKLAEFLTASGLNTEAFAQALVEVFGVVTEAKSPSSLKSRLMLEFPDLAEALAAVFGSPAIVRTWETQPSQAVALCRAAQVLLAATDQSRLSNLGVRFFNDSKQLRRGTEAYNLLGDLLRAQLEAPELSREQAFERCQVVANGTAVKATVFGRIRYRCGRHTFEWIRDLSVQGQAAVLTMQNLESIDELILDGKPEFIITCENETPFCELVDSDPAVPVFYTGGYPNAAVRRLLSLLPGHVRTIRHWGDTDLDGLLIANILDAFRPVDLWRGDLGSAERLKTSLLPLASDKRHRAETLLRHRPDFRFAEELRFALRFGWLEQEAWRE